MTTITLRYFDGCPNWEVARRRLQEAIGLVDFATDVQLERIQTAEDADRVSFRGSPTILIDGRDVFADPSAPTGLSCRVYRTEIGMEGSPSVSQLVSALKESS
nr:thioredoxin family protein [Actinomycetota bacterium]